MLGGDAADDPGLAQVGAPQVFQGDDLVGQLPQVLLDALGFAAGAGGAQAQLAGVQVQLGRGQGAGLQLVQGRVLVGQPQVDFARPALAGLGLQVSGQQHAGPGTPGAQQGHRQFHGVFQMHRQAPYAMGLQGSGQAQGLFLHGPQVDGRRGADRSRRM